MSAVAATPVPAGERIVRCPVCDEPNNRDRGRQACHRCGWLLWSDTPILNADAAQFEAELAAAQERWRARLAAEQAQPPVSRWYRESVLRWRRRLEPLARPAAIVAVLCLGLFGLVIAYYALAAAANLASTALNSAATAPAGTMLALALKGAFFLLVLVGLLGAVSSADTKAAVVIPLLLAAKAFSGLPPGSESLLGPVTSFVPSVIDDVALHGGGKAWAAFQAIGNGEWGRLFRRVDDVAPPPRLCTAGTPGCPNLFHPLHSDLFGDPGRIKPFALPGRLDPLVPSGLGKPCAFGGPGCPDGSADANPLAPVKPFGGQDQARGLVTVRHPCRLGDSECWSKTLTLEPEPTALRRLLCPDGDAACLRTAVKPAQATPPAQTVPSPFGPLPAQAVPNPSGTPPAQTMPNPFATPPARTTPLCDADCRRQIDALLKAAATGTSPPGRPQP